MLTLESPGPRLDFGPPFDVAMETIYTGDALQLDYPVQAFRLAF